MSVDNKTKENVIKNNKIVYYLDNDIYRFTHTYDYDYRVAEGFMGLDLNWYTGSGSWNFGTAASRQISNDKNSTAPNEYTLNTLQNNYTIWTKKGDQYCFRYLYWDENWNKPSVS